jgi:hypothetical protein
MREALALITFVLLFWIGWDQSYRDHFSNVLTGRPTQAGKRVAAQQGLPPEFVTTSTTATPARDNSWMWQKSKLDSPHEGNSRHAR